MINLPTGEDWWDSIGKDLVPKAEITPGELPHVIRSIVILAFNLGKTAGWYQCKARAIAQKHSPVSLSRTMKR